MGAIVWVASYPKSGNTWVRVFLNNLLRPDEAPHRIDRLGKVSVPNVGARWFQGLLERPLEKSSQEDVARTRAAAQARLAASVPGLIFAKTHSVFGVDFGYPNINKTVTAGAIYIVRNPLDVAISLSHYLGIDIDQAIARMSTPGYRNENEPRFSYEPWGSWSENVQSWTRTAHQALFVMRYEDMLAKPEETFAKLRAFLLIESAPGALQTAIEHSDFARLREQETIYGFGNLPPGERFFREGRAGGWREQLTAEQVNRIVDCHREQMERFGYTPDDAAPPVSGSRERQPPQGSTSTPDRAVGEADLPLDWAATLHVIAQRVEAAGGAPSIASHIDAVRRQAPHTVKSWAALGQALMAAGWLDEADATYRALAASYPAEPAGPVGQARVAARRPNWTLALELWTSCLECFSSEAAHMWHGERATALAHLGRLDESDAIFRGLTVSRPQKSAGFVGLARNAMRRKSWDAAEERWTACLERFPMEDGADWRVARGDALVESGRLEDATEVYCDVLRGSPGHPTAALRLVTVASPASPRIHDELVAAVSALERSVELKPADVDARLQLATLLQTMGSLDPAITQFQETLRRWRAQRPVTAHRSSGSAPRNTGVIHLVSPIVAVGGQTHRCIELFRLLEGKCQVRLWSPPGSEPPAPMFTRQFTIETIALEAGRFPRHGTLVLVVPNMNLDWLRRADPDRVIQICNFLRPSVMMHALDAFDRAGVREVEFVYASELMRDATGMPGIVEPSLIDLDRFEPRSRDPREAGDFIVGRLSRDVLSKHSPDDPELYRGLANAGCRIRIMGGICLEPRLRGVAGVELLPAQATAAATFLQGLDCFVYRTSSAIVEAFGRVVSEAMACGLPVVCHRNGGYREIIEHGTNGFLFDTTAEAREIVLRLKADRELRHSIGSAASATVEALQGPAARKAVANFYLGRTG